MAILSYITASLVAAISVQAGSIAKRGTVGNDVIVGLAAAVPSGTVGTVYTTYQPYLKVLKMILFSLMCEKLTTTRSPMDAFHFQESTLQAIPSMLPKQLFHIVSNSF